MGAAPAAPDAPDAPDYDRVAAALGSRLPRGYDAWVRAFGLEVRVADLLRTVCLWTVRAAPADATEEDRALACMDLTLSFAELDDYAGVDEEGLFAEHLAVLDGARPGPAVPSRAERAACPGNGPGASARARAHADLLDRLGRRGAPLTHYLGGRHAVVDAYRIRNAVRRRERRLSFAAYLDLRLTTIFVAQWVDLWEIVGGFALTPAERARPERAVAVEAACLWHVLHNDVVSRARDAARGEPNLVALAAVEEGVTADEAARRLLARARVAAAELDEAAAAFVAAAPGGRAARYAAFLGTCVQAGVDNYYRDNPARYAAAPPA
jgi:hypothetical protein